MKQIKVVFSLLWSERVCFTISLRVIPEPKQKTQIVADKIFTEGI